MDIENIVNEKEIKKIMKSEISKKVKEADIESVLDVNIYDMVEESVCKELRKRFEEGNKLEQHITKVVKDETLVWIENNICASMLKDILKEAMVEKLKEFSFEQVKELINTIK